MASDHHSSDPAPQRQTMALEHNILSPATQCQNKVSEDNTLGPEPQSQENVHIADKTVTTSLNELEILFSPMFDEYFNESTQVVLKSSAVTTTNASDKRQQPNITPSTSTTIATNITQLNIQTTPEPTTQAPTVNADENINQAENIMFDEDNFINPLGTPIPEVEVHHLAILIPSNIIHIYSTNKHILLNTIGQETIHWNKFIEILHSQLEQDDS
ncbi:hypothetical protein Tco_0891260 [Tanacetum coccineum]|uniref:Uncharacterized protein n=1 Tax=Tanacetum coccineum TaxID=301880 RepID=A0ABQ5C3Y9_9ASTR